MRILIIFIFLVSKSFAVETVHIKNLFENKKLKKYDELTFLDDKQNSLNLNDFEGKLILLNFWATWCAPCREEMPYLDELASNKDFKNILVIPINIGRESKEKAENFFKEINIKNLNLYYDSSIELPNKLSLRGVPTTILVNKNGEEFARILGAVDFKNKELLSWLNKFD